MKSLYLICILSLFVTVPQINAEEFQKISNSEMKKFSSFIGSWKLDEIDEATPFGPAGKATFKTKSRFLFNGHVFEERGSGKVGDLKVDYLILTHYDAAAKKFRSTYYDSNGAVFAGEGSIEGRTIKGSSTQEINGKTYKMKNESTLSEDGKKFTYEWLYSEDGQNWKPVLRGSGIRTGR